MKDGDADEMVPIDSHVPTLALAQRPGVFFLAGDAKAGAFAVVGGPHVDHGAGGPPGLRSVGLVPCW